MAADVYLTLDVSLTLGVYMAADVYLTLDATLTMVESEQRRF